MAGNRSRSLATVLAMVCLLSLWLSRSKAQEDRAPDRISELVKSAKQTLVAFETSYQVGNASAEDVYRWSLRLMEAELLANSTNDAPARNHRDRMLKLHQQVATLHAAGAVGGEVAALHATEYYLAEANILPGE